MVTLREVIQDVAAMANRQAITEEELKRLLGYLSQPLPIGVPRQGDARPVMQADSIAPPESSHRPTYSGKAQRTYFGRKPYGWVNLERAEDLDLVALLDLGGTARRVEILDHILGKWGPSLIAADLETLASSGEQRWRKTCQWGLYYLQKEGLVVRPQRGVQALTDRGRSEAESRRKTPGA